MSLPAGVVDELKRQFQLIYISGDIFAHCHQQHFTVFTASGNICQCRFQLVSWVS
jgi:hypothetical protein